MGGDLCRKYRELASLVEWLVSPSRQRSRSEGIRRSRRVRLCGREAAASARLFRATPGEIRGKKCASCVLPLDRVLELRPRISAAGAAGPLEHFLFFDL